MSHQVLYVCGKRNKRCNLFKTICHEYSRGSVTTLTLHILYFINIENLINAWLWCYTVSTVFWEPVRSLKFAGPIQCDGHRLECVVWYIFVHHLAWKAKMCNLICTLEIKPHYVTFVLILSVFLLPFKRFQLTRKRSC